MNQYSTINIRHNFPEIAAKLNQLADNVANKVLVRAMNDSMAQGKIEMGRQISQEFRVTVSQVKERLAITKAYTKGGTYHFQAILRATRKGKGRSMNLIHFVTGSKVSKAAAKRRGNTSLANQIQFQIKRSGGKKVIPGAFVATNRVTGGTAVFIRTGKNRLPIRTIMTLDVPQMFNTKRINSVVRQVMLSKFEANFQRQLRAVLGGFTR